MPYKSEAQRKYFNANKDKICIKEAHAINIKNILTLL